MKKKEIYPYLVKRGKEDDGDKKQNKEHFLRGKWKSRGTRRASRGKQRKVRRKQKKSFIYHLYSCHSYEEEEKEERIRKEGKRRVE